MLCEIGWCVGCVGLCEIGWCGYDDDWGCCEWLLYECGIG